MATWGPFGPGDAAVPPPPPPLDVAAAQRRVEQQSTQSAQSVQGVLANAPPPPKKKQKRNKPTLSCDRCVERKAKGDRGRPQCLACIRRRSQCRYSQAANLIAE
ncbi:hypothetical protein B0J12DRAFT_674193 [Macrophomina phaseolina]|uniref:Zn(2)-C6 fungal-type domain-containing protein n=1 Tax=Macrophomina phaseolina TaxID=35725 RepID=A0ABQ8G271_9PEZI|nr:hypothetical protein B0J12DRAFT_674193 [Macrophomina phaseolina]